MILPSLMLSDLFHFHIAAIGIAIILHMILGYLWYSPYLFLNKWIKLIKVEVLQDAKKAQQDCMHGMIISLIGGGVTAIILSLIIHALGALTFGGGMMVATLLWLGTVAPTMAAGYCFSQKPLKLFLIDAGFPLVSFCARGGVIAIIR